MARGKLLPETLACYVRKAWPTLIEVAKERTVITYSELMERLDGPGRAYIGEVVGQISKNESQEKHPLLSAVVVLKNRGMPSEGFWEGPSYEQARKRGVGKEDFWESELKKAYDYWQRHDF